MTGVACPKIDAQLAVTSEEGVVFNPARSGSGSDGESVAENSSCGNSKEDNSMLDLSNGGR